MALQPLHKILFMEVKQMRELFTAPEAEVVTFAAQDIVTTSKVEGETEEDPL